MNQIWQRIEAAEGHAQAARESGDGKLAEEHLEASKKQARKAGKELITVVWNQLL